MFTLQQLKAAHAKVKSGADFPKYIKEIKDLGLISYEFLVVDGRTVYYGDNDHLVTGDAIYQPKEINTTASADALKHTIAIHQQGQTDFLTFCKEAAHAGVEKWVIDTKKMICTYQNLQGNTVVAEPIPDGDY